MIKEIMILLLGLVAFIAAVLVFIVMLLVGWEVISHAADELYGGEEWKD